MHLVFVARSIVVQRNHSIEVYEHTVLMMNLHEVESIENAVKQQQK